MHTYIQPFSLQQIRQIAKCFQSLRVMSYSYALPPERTYLNNKHISGTLQQAASCHSLTFKKMFGDNYCLSFDLTPYPKHISVH